VPSCTRAGKQEEDLFSHFDPLIDQAYALARQNGALGGKITGAGGGGFLLLFSEERHRKRSAMRWRNSVCAKWRLDLISKALTWWPMIHSSTAMRKADALDLVPGFASRTSAELPFSGLSDLHE